MSNLQQMKKRLQIVVVATFYMLFLSTCTSLPEARVTMVIPIAQSEARPVRAQVPGPVPARAAVPGAAKFRQIVVPSQLRRPPATYRHVGRRVRAHIPAFEIPVAGSDEQRRSVKLPNPVHTDPINGNLGNKRPVSINLGTIIPEKSKNVTAPDPKPLSWTGTTTAFTSTSFLDNVTFNSSSVFIPPDSHAAAGLNHVVDVVNNVITIHKKDGTIDFQTSMDSFFSSLSPLGKSTFDPRVLYDQYAARWVVVVVEQTETSSGASANTSRIFVAVSDDSNPNGTWYVSQINSLVNTGVDNWADYPALAVDKEVVYITTNLFGFNGGTFAGARVWVLTKGVGLGGLYDGGALSTAVFDPYAASGFLMTTIPAHMYGTPPAGVGTFLVGFQGLTDGTNEFIQVVRFDDPLNTAVFTLSDVSLGDVDNTALGLPDAPQSGSSALISTNDRRALDAVWRNNAVWMTTTINPSSGIDSGETTAFWAKIDTTTLSSLSLADSGTIGGEDIAAGTYTSFPSLAVNVNDDAVVGFSASAPSIFAGAYFVDRQTADAAGTMGSSVTVKAGVADYFRAFGGSSNRWGDYSATTLDPADECFWVFNQWADTKGTVISGEDGRWGTAYAKTCPSNPPIVCSATQSISANLWTRFSLPCDVAPTNTVADIFSGLSAATYGTNWVVYKRDAATTSYVLLATTDTMAIGVGYWVFSTTTTQVGLAGAPDATTDITLTGVATTGRDNYIGHNQNTTVNWNQVQVVDGTSVLGIAGYDPLDQNSKFACTAPVSSACLMSHLMNKWNGSAYQVFDGDVAGGSPGTLSAFDGFWVKAFKVGIKLRIPVGSSAKPVSGTVSLKPGTSAVASAAAVAGAKIEIQKNAGKKIEGRDVDGRDVQGRDRHKHKKPKKPKKPKGQAWHVRLIVSAGEMEDPGNVLGQLADATEGNDRHDLPEPPPFGAKYLSILFDNPMFKQTNWGFTTDFRALTRHPEGIWPFVVKAYDGIDEVSIRVEGEEQLFKESWLVDEESGEVIKVHAGDSYTFDIHGGEHFFRFEQGDD